MSYATGPEPKYHDTPTTRMGASLGKGSDVKGTLIKGKIDNTPVTAFKPQRKKRMAAG